MSQFRLTQKFAKDYGVETLLEPIEIKLLLDDWFIDVIRVSRKKVAMFTQSTTMLTFFVPYADAGGAKKTPGSLPGMLKDYLSLHGLDEYTKNIELFFDTPFSFCKTKDRKVLGHMNDFKYCIGAYTDGVPFESINWNTIAEQINETPMNLHEKGYSSPHELMKDLLVG